MDRFRLLVCLFVYIQLFLFFSFLFRKLKENELWRRDLSAPVRVLFQVKLSSRITLTEMGAINEFHWTYIKATIPERKHRRAFSGPLGEGVSNTAYIIL